MYSIDVGLTFEIKQAFKDLKICTVAKYLFHYPPCGAIYEKNTCHLTNGLPGTGVPACFYIHRTVSHLIRGSVTSVMPAQT